MKEKELKKSMHAPLTIVLIADDVKLNLPKAPER